jgi:uncharacterized protein (TIGR03437 family)
MIELPQIRIGGVNAAVQFAGLVSPGLFQFNVVVPGSLNDGGQPVEAIHGGATTPSGPLLSVHH